MGVRVALAAALALTAGFAWAAQLPETWPRCRRKDPNLDFCLQHAIQVSIPQMAAGVPELEVPPLEGRRVANGFSIERQPARISLQMNVTNLRSYGLSNVKILSVFSDLDNGIIDIYGNFPLSFLNGDMEIEGTILHEPVSSQRGVVNFTFSELEGFLVVSGRTVERDGDVFLDVDFARSTILSLGGLGVVFDPLDKSPQRSSKLNYLLNANALAFWPDMREALQTLYAEEFRQLTNSILSKVPLKDIFLADDHPAVLSGPSSLLLLGR